MKVKELEEKFKSGEFLIKEWHGTKAVVYELTDLNKVRVATLTYSQIQKIKEKFRYSVNSDFSGFTTHYYQFKPNRI